MQYGHVIATIFGQPWAILPETLETIAELVRMRAEGEHLTESEIRARLDVAAASAGPRVGGRVAGSVGIIPVYGTIMQRASLMTQMSGGTSVQGITEAFRQALGDESIGSILLEFDSPGGQAGGLAELAAEIRAARGRKPIVAIANTLCASAAYWLASSADEVVATPTSEIGSIGVRAVHQDASAALDKAGIKMTPISAGKYKMEGNPWQPLTPEAEAAIQQTVDDIYALFVADVARGRGTTPAAVRAGYGEGRVLTAKRAVDAGLADRVGTMDDTLLRMAAGRIVPRGTSAATEGPEIEAQLPTADASVALAIARARVNAS